MCSRVVSVVRVLDFQNVVERLGAPSVFLVVVLGAQHPLVVPRGVLVGLGLGVRGLSSAVLLDRGAVVVVLDDGLVRHLFIYTEKFLGSIVYLINLQ